MCGSQFLSLSCLVVEAHEELGYICYTVVESDLVAVQGADV